jgi:hypothetical protein
VNGLPSDLIPSAELPLDNVTQQEADEYQQFLDQYNSYWRTFFDPIAIRVKIDGKRYRAETIVLPLINNSIYNAMAATLGGKPQALDKLPVPKGNIFSMLMQLNKDNLMRENEFQGLFRHNLLLGSGADLHDIGIGGFLRDGLGSQVGLHIYDSNPLFDLNLSSLAGQMFASGTGRFFGNDTLWITMLAASLNSPVYVSFDIKDRKIVDEFLERLDKELAMLARRPPDTGWFAIENDFYRLTTETAGQTGRSVAGTAAADAPIVRAYTLAFGPLKWRFFSARIGDGFYVASKKFIIDDLIAATRKQTEEAASNGASRASDANRWQPVAHAMVRVRPENWTAVIPEYQLGWAENNRRSVLNHLSMLSSVARAAVAADPGLLGQEPALAGESIVRQAESLYGVRFEPADGGKYLLSRDGKSVTHSIYGSQSEPVQPAAPASGGRDAELLSGFAGATAELTFLEGGLHAVLTIERK